MNILIDSNIPLLSEILSESYNVIEFEGGELSNGFIQESNADCLFVRSTTKCDVFLLGNTKVKFVGTATAGTDNIDKEYFNKNDIKWINAVGSNSLSVTEYVTLAIQHWCIDNIKKIEDLTIGIVGHGNIGKKVAKVFNKYGKQVIVSDPFVEIKEYENVRKCDYNDLLKQSDIITFHTPLTKVGKFPTYRMLNTKNIRNVNEGTLLINASRGGVISEDAIKSVDYNLNNLVLDVWENEPTPNPMLISKSFISTPHIAGHSIEAKLRGSLNMIQAFELYTGHRINKDILIERINSKIKTDFDELDFYSLFKKLKNNINLMNTSNDFKSKLFEANNYNFSELRKSYKKHNETLVNELI
jgi:erythronate-4-phosphate dehydrogenase